MSFALRAFRWPVLWLCAWLALVMAVLAVSLLPARDLPPMPFDGVDKIEHLLAYAAMSAGAVMLFASRGAHALIAFALVAVGIALEFGQGALTASRMADPLDALANALGVLAGWWLGQTPVAGWLQSLDARLAGASRRTD